MARRRKLIRATETPSKDPYEITQRTTKGTSETLVERKPRRRLVRRGAEHPAVAQFAGYPEVQAKVRAVIIRDPELRPTAFSWSPLRMGAFLCAAEAERVKAGQSIRVPGLVMSAGKDALCRDCWIPAKDEGLLAGKGYEVTLYEPKRKNEHTARKCIRCGAEFHGETSWHW